MLARGILFPLLLLSGCLSHATTPHHQITQPAPPIDAATPSEPENGNTTGNPIRNATANASYQWAVGANATIHPGARISVTTNAGAAWCTLAFIYRNQDNSTLYGATAGHCLRNVGDAVSLFNATTWKPGLRIGHVAAMRFDDHHDWGLIEITGQARPHVTPAMAYWTGPTAQITLNDLPFDAVLCHYGWSNYAMTEHTIHRCGRYDNGATFRGAASSGDSGSPIIDHATGQAIGILTTVGPTPPLLPVAGPFSAGLIGFTPACVLTKEAALDGLTLALATAPYHPPMEDPTVPNLAPLFKANPPC